MEYVYAALTLNESGAEINEENITAVLEAADPEEYRGKLEDNQGRSVPLGEAARDWIRAYARYFRDLMEEEGADADDQRRNPDRDR